MGSEINKDATARELSSLYTVSGDTIVFYGDRDTLGAPTNIGTIEFKRADGSFCCVEFNSEHLPLSVYSSNGVVIDFEWLDNEKAAVQIFNSQDNTYINTTWNLNEMPPIPSAQDGGNQKPVESRIGQKTRFNLKRNYSKSQSDGAVHLDPPDGFQQIHLWVKKCDEDYSAKAFIEVRDLRDNSYVTRLWEREVLSRGNYFYYLPKNSYPASCTNAEWCARFDAVLLTLGKGLKWLAAMEGGLGVWLNYFAVATGIGFVPAAVVDALWAATAAGSLLMEIVDNAGGVSGIMESFNPAWYYQEFVVGDLSVTPYVLDCGGWTKGEASTINESESSRLLTYEFDGEPVLDSFKLEPSNPAEYQSYTATASYHCVPYGSTITLSIVGTDGYSDTLIQRVTTANGVGVLYVPGSYGGVYDVCTVEIVTPDGKSLSLQASLVFGYN
ncbi:MAG: hypothetical protein IJ160_11170 [Muribaculaceae bacterium]|nr:hypothetical protein [Muribaculaceae bacterium]